MLRARLIVYFAHYLVLVSNALPTISHFAARTIRFRKTRGEFHCYGTEQRRIDAVTYKRSFQHNRPTRIASGRSERRKVARQHRCCWDERTRVAGILAQLCPLVAAEEK